MAVATASAMTSTQEIKLSAQLDDWRLDGAVPRPTDLPDVLSVEAANGPNGVLISRSIIQVLPRGGVGQLSVELTASAPLKAVFGWVRIEYPHLRSAVFIAQSVALEGNKASMSAPLYLPLDATGVSMWMKVIGLPDKDRLSIAAKLVPVESALPNAEVDQVIDVIRRRAIRSKDVNWESVSAMARTIEARRVGGSGVSDAALKFIVTSLGDGHSFLIANEPPAQPVAVLQDGRSASSAEALLMAFKRRPETRLFGAPSAGLTTANAVVDVAGKSVALSTSMMADSYKVTYPKGIEPDEAMRETELRAAPDAESLRAPIAWLESRCKRSEETLSVK